ncbi:DUF4913 domain-containing protein [Luteipulveratus mongoliensis]|uniref:DUF4913 domain-containing protein n=1 Tax=Luteipulveratus mongoliensis TaxID=571913 RepID=A0A0K1JEB4_9MICO|nr:DUF4913 domain-containing protein [Luteipulveratus mongoliensis]AKU15046.1 hypothetical protein VV02_02880 [Luteipulveratus mongoliensis]
MSRDEEQYRDRLVVVSDSSERAPVIAYGSLPQFVERCILPNWRHETGGNDGARWCPRWWAHSEAISVLDGLWESFEVMRLEPIPAMSLWRRDHLYPHMAHLTRPDGTFWQCGLDKRTREFKHVVPDMWPVEQPPPGVFTAEPSLADQV